MEFGTKIYSILADRFRIERDILDQAKICVDETIVKDLLLALERIDTKCSFSVMSEIQCDIQNREKRQV